MIPALAGVLTPLRPHLVPSLCTEGELGAITDLAATLPMVPAGGFERSLGPGRSGLDLAICVRHAQPAARTLQEDGQGGEALQALLAATEDPRSSLWDALDMFWLEFDVSRGGRTPSLFVSPRRGDPLEVVQHATAVVRGCAPSPREVKALSWWLEPVAGVRVFQVGWMLSRARPGLRLCFVAHDPGAVRRMLERVALPAQRQTLLECVQRYGRHVTEFSLAIDVGDGELAPRMGLELSFRGSKGAAPLERWSDLLCAFEADGLCTRRERVALLRWPGRMVERDAPERWPVHLRGAGVLLGPYATRIDRMLHHAKIVVEDGAVQGAKVYFGVRHGWALA